MIHDIAPLIIADPDVRSGKAIIAWPRLPVDLVVGKVAGGMPISDIDRDYE